MDEIALCFGGMEIVFFFSSLISRRMSGSKTKKR
jgi:hypothetical protein